MEYERSIFLVHKRIIRGEIFRVASVICGYSALSLALLGLCITIFGHILYPAGTGCFAEAFQEYQNLHKTNFFPDTMDSDLRESRRKFLESANKSNEEGPKIKYPLTKSEILSKPILLFLFHLDVKIS